MSATSTLMENFAGWRYRRKMGEFTNSRPLGTLAWMVAATIVGLNAWLLLGTTKIWLA